MSCVNIVPCMHFLNSLLQYEVLKHFLQDLAIALSLIKRKEDLLLQNLRLSCGKIKF